MTGAAKTRLGKAPCTNCGEPTMVFRHATTDTLTQCCQECGWSTFAKKGEPAHGTLLAKVGAEVKPEPTGTKPPPPTKAPKSVFDLGTL